MLTKFFDIHVHIPDPNTFPLFVEKGNKKLIMRLLLFTMKIGGKKLTPEYIKSYNNRIIEFIDNSMFDHVVFLALDSAHDEKGNEIAGANSIICTNDYVTEVCRLSQKTLFGASIHPYRKNAIKILEKCIKNGACLVKWIPSAQNIDPANDKCHGFYEMLAVHGVPLLCHTGNEHTLSGYTNAYNEPVRLIPALKRGVTVIAAHCGARMFLHEKTYFDSWCRMALEYENCYGDISAFVIPTRLFLITKLKCDKTLFSKILYGSDFPGFPDFWSCLFKIGINKVMELRKEKNPFNRRMQVTRELGLSDEIFSRAGKLLRYPNISKSIV